MRSQLTKNILIAAVGAVVLASAVTSPVARAGTSTNTTGPVRQGTSTGLPTDYANNYPAVTISLSGQAALRVFTATAGLSVLQPGTSATFYFGPTGVPVTYYAPNDGSTYVQLASKNFGTTDTGILGSSFATVPTVQNHSALRVEWHEQGSVQGLIDLINDQVGYTTGIGGTGIISNVASRGPSVANPTWINGNQFQAGGTISGHALAGGNFGDTYDTSIYDRVTGRNLQGGQNRIQYSQGEYKTEAFAFAGTPSRSALPGGPGFGAGNPALPAASTPAGLGNAGGRQSFSPQSYANQSTDKVNPESATSDHYAAGPWNTAGAYNVDSQQFAVNAVAYTANPGTGLYHINKGDAQWLLTSGRLQNGADFNVVMRANDAGQRTVPAVNVGVDPSWAVGENDNGNTSGTAAQNAQKSLGADFRFSGKTSGTEARAAIAQSRLGFGPLAVSEARAASSAAPVRSLDVDFVHQADSGNAADFKRANFDNIVNFNYRAVLISHINTIKAPNINLLSAYRTQFQTANGRAPTADEEQTWWNGLTSAETGIKGDQFGNVRSFVNNILGSVGTAAAGLSAASANNPADALFSNGYLIPGLLNYKREYDGGPLTPNPLNAAQLALQQDVKANYGPLFTTDGTAGSNAQTIGSSALYGALNANGLTINGQVPITAKDAAGNAVPNGTVAPKGNYLFGNFLQNGWRDFAAVKESLNAALSLRAVDGSVGSIYTVDGGVPNSTVIPSLSGSPGWATTANTKGDLIVLGDFNSDGRFDGRDVYLLARGASLADNASTDQLTTASGATFADAVRNPNALLRKNAALDYFDAALNTPSNANQLFIRQTASANLTNDPNGVNAFNKRDVNRDGRLDLNDAFAVDKFFGQDYHNLDQQLAATLNTDGTIDPTLAQQKPISLVDIELTDNGAIDAADITVVNQALTGTGNESWAAGTRTKVGAGNIVVARTGGTVSVAAGATLDVAAGQFTVAGTRDVFTDTSTQAHVAVRASSTGTLQIASGGPKVTVSGITISGSGKVDLTNNALGIDYSGTSPIDTVRSYLLASRNGGAWNGTGGIVSSVAQADPQQIHAVAYIEANLLSSARQTTLLGHLSDGTTLVAAYTYYGDANVDGLLNADDFALVDRGFARALANPHWTDGDFNYDGQVTTADYFLLDRTYGILQGVLSPAFLAEREAEFGGEYVSQLIAAVPEPGLLAIAPAAGLLLTRRRRTQAG